MESGRAADCTDDCAAAVCSKRREKLTIPESKSDLHNVYYPDWFLTEIFTRLPIKSTFRFKSVSKQLFSLISDPSFTRSYISHALSPPPWTLLDPEIYADISHDLSPNEYDLWKNLFSDDYKCPSFSVIVFPRPQQPQLQGQGPDPGTTYRILALSNGLLLCCRHFGIQPCYYNICNPVTRQSINLPLNNRVFNWSSEGFITKVENGVAGSYKVVRIDLCRSNSNLKFEIFSSETGEWEDFDVYLTYSLNKNCPALPFEFNGILHWIDYISGIIAYDPYKDPRQYRLIPLPEERDFRREARYGGKTALCQVHGGHLKFFEMKGNNVSPFGFEGLDLWMLKDYDDGIWCLEHRISHSEISFHSNLESEMSRRPLVRMFPFGNDFDLRPFDLDLTPIAFHPFDSDIMYLGHRKLIVSCNVRTGRLEGQGEPVVVTRRFGGQRDPVRVRRTLIWWCIKLYVLPSWPTTIPKPSW